MKLRTLLSFILSCFVFQQLPNLKAQTQGWIWQFNANTRYHDLQKRPNGNTVVLTQNALVGHGQIVELDSFGNEIGRLDSILFGYDVRRLVLRNDPNTPYALIALKSNAVDSAFLFELNALGQPVSRRFLVESNQIAPNGNIYGLTISPAVFQINNAGEYLIGLSYTHNIFGYGNTYSIFKVNATQITHIDVENALYQNRTLLYAASNRFAFVYRDAVNMPNNIQYMSFDANSTNTTPVLNTSIATPNNISSEVLNLNLAANGDLLVAYCQTVTNSSVLNSRILRFDGLGQVVSDRLLSTAPNSNGERILQVIESSDGNYFVMKRIGYTTYKIQKIDANTLTTLWTYDLSDYGFTNYNQAALGTANPANIYPLNNGGVCILADKGVIQITANGQVFPNWVRGHLYHDIDQSCTQTVGDSTIPQNLIVATHNTTNQQYWAFSQADGTYEINVPNGTYTISSANSYSALLWQNCANSLNTSALNGTTLSLDTVDIFRQSLYNCPLMVADIHNGLLRPCDTASLNLKISNIGTQSSGANTYVDVELDPALTYISLSSPATYAHTPLGNNKHRFVLPNINPNTFVSFYIRALLDCNAPMGQVHCNEAHVFPDSICGLTWNGSNIQVADTCLNGDSIRFVLRNIGTNMPNAQTYNIIEDNLMFRPNTAFQLASGQSLTITIPAQTGSVYILNVQQAAGFPNALGGATTSRVVLNCNGNTTNSNLILQYLTNRLQPAIDIACTPNRNSYDPNRKSADILGYGNQHFIEANTPLEYTIEFQNTGTDTARLVQIYDTLATQLDIRTLQLGASSHPYRADIVDGRALRFTFERIMLVDSATNEPRSKGFVSFKINQNQNLPVGTIINNRAGIYFDLNAPIQTNTVFHTIGQDFVGVRVAVDEPTNTNNPTVRVYPNPFETEATLEVFGTELFEDLTLRIFDNTGKQVQIIEAQHTNRISLQKQDLSAGLYFFQLSNQGNVLGTGKIMVK
jgi:uncharacterized repeat protein (TIGR01451 family)